MADIPTEHTGAVPAVAAEVVTPASEASVRAAAPPVPPVVVRQRSHLWGAMAATFITMIGATSFLAWHFLPSARIAQHDATQAAAMVYQDLRAGLDEVTQTLTQGAVPSVETKTLVESALGELSARGKLVVLTRTLPVHVEKRATRRVLWDQFALEDSIVRLRVANNRVQYCVPLDRLGDGNFAYDPATQLLTITVPEPRLDRELVSVSDNPSDWLVEKDISWSRVRDWYGEQLMNEARASLRGLVIAAAEEPLVMKEAREQGYTQLASLVKSVLSPFVPNVRVEVRYDPALNTPRDVEPLPSNASVS